MAIMDVDGAILYEDHEDCHMLLISHPVCHVGAVNILSEPFLDSSRADAPGSSEPYVTLVASVILSLSDKEDWKVMIVTFVLPFFEDIFSFSFF
jgi:hypothetical protein